MDAQVGKVLDALKDSGELENTIIVLWGDHGWHLGDHGLWNKHTNFEHATHVPMLIIDPSARGKRRVTAPVEFYLYILRYAIWQVWLNLLTWTERALRGL